VGRLRLREVEQLLVNAYCAEQGGGINGAGETIEQLAPQLRRACSRFLRVMLRLEFVFGKGRFYVTGHDGLCGTEKGAPCHCGRGKWRAICDELLPMLEAERKLARARRRR